MNRFKYLGYAAFFLGALIVCIYLTFPWGSAKDRALAEATRASGIPISATSVEPDWVTGFVAENVELQPPGFATPIILERVEARAHVLPLLTGGKGLTVTMPIAQGEVEAEVVDSAASSDVKAEATGVEIGLIPGLKEATGLPMLGKLDLKADFTLDKTKPEASSGVLHLVGEGLELQKGGKIKGMTLPFELAIGDLDWTIPIEEGKAKLSKLQVSGGSALLELDGTVTVDKVPMRSVLNLTLKFKPTEAFLKKEPLLAALLNNIRQAKGSDGFYGYSLTGTLKHPRVFPKRGGR